MVSTQASIISIIGLCVAVTGFFYIVKVKKWKTFENGKQKCSDSDVVNAKSSNNMETTSLQNKNKSLVDKENNELEKSKITEESLELNEINVECKQDDSKIENEFRMKEHFIQKNINNSEEKDTEQNILSHENENVEIVKEDELALKEENNEKKIVNETNLVGIESIIESGTEDLVKIIKTTEQQIVKEDELALKEANEKKTGMETY